MRRLLPGPTAELTEEALRAAYRPPAGPFVRAMMIASADGAATRDGRSGGLGSPADQHVLALIRDTADAVLVGRATVAAEGYAPGRPNPDRMRRRAAAGLAPTLRTVVVSGRCALEPGWPVFSGADPLSRPIILTTADAPRDRREALAAVAEIVTVPGAGADLDLAAGLDLLADRGLSRLVCEGGPHLLASLAATSRLDELCLTVSPLLLGGDAGRITGGRGVDGRLRLDHVLDDDGLLFLRYAVLGGPPAAPPGPQ